MVHIWDWNIYSYDMNLKRVTEIIDSHDIAYYSQFGQKIFFSFRIGSNSYVIYMFS